MVTMLYLEYLACEFEEHLFSWVELALRIVEHISRPRRTSRVHQVFNPDHLDLVEFM
jgi:hypothetical protein